MKLTIDPLENLVILRIHGEFDTFGCPRFLEEIDGLLAAGVQHVVVNLRLVKFINSTALGAILEASQRLEVEGHLVVSRPSKFCREVMQSIGMHQVVPIFDSDEEACQALKEGISQFNDEGMLDAEVGQALEDPTVLIFSPCDADHVRHFIPEASGRRANPLHGHAFGKNWRGIAQMTALDDQGLRFLWDGNRTQLSPFQMGQMLSIGTRLDVKFRLPLLRKGHCEAVVRVGELEEREDGVKISVVFESIEAGTRELVRQYAADIAFLKSELSVAGR